jgi:hypothetical protein
VHLGADSGTGEIRNPKADPLRQSDSAARIRKKAEIRTCGSVLRDSAFGLGNVCSLSNCLARRSIEESQSLWMENGPRGGGIHGRSEVEVSFCSVQSSWPGGSHAATLRLLYIVGQMRSKSGQDRRQAGIQRGDAEGAEVRGEIIEGKHFDVFIPRSLAPSNDRARAHYNRLT